MIAPVLPTYNRTDFAFDTAEGARLTTPEGETYLDFGAGIAVNSLGHGHPHLVETLRANAARPWHVSNLYRIPEGERLARRLVEATFADTVFFCNSGAEAAECAIKMARKYHAAAGAPERYRIVTMEGAFHGRTLATIAAGGQKKYLDGFGPAVDGFDQVPFCDLDAVRAAIGPATAAILVEPVQGEGGIRAIPADVLKALRRIADDNGLLLIFDEVQCGMGRTGHLFAHQEHGVEPDIMTSAKALGNGFPVGACLATERAAAAMTAGSHGSTYGGNPLAMAVANAVLDVVLEEGFLDRVRRAAIRLGQKLARLKDDYADLVEDIRGTGLIRGLKLKVPSGDLVAACLEERLLTVAAGDNVVRLTPPLIVTDADIDEAADRLERALGRLRAAASLPRAS